MKETYSGRTPNYGFLSRFMYGVGEIFGGGCFVIINSFFIVFLTDALGLNAALAGTIPMIGKIWDAITDPIMGNICERTRSKFGAKRFYILVGSIASAITFVAMWINIHSSSTTANYIFYLVMYCLFNTGFTVLSVPYNGLLPDMMDDYAVRAKFSNMRMIFSTIGAAVCGLVPGMMIKQTYDPSQYMKCMLLFGVLFFVCSITVFFGTWEKQKEPVKTTLGESFTQAASVFRSRSFLIFLGLYLFGQGGMDFISGMAVYYVQHTLGAYPSYYIPILAVLMIAQLVGMLIFGPVMSKTSKKLAIVIAAPLRLVGVLGLLAFSHHGAPLVPILALAALIGLGNAGSLTGIFAIMADMTDIDELITSVPSCLRLCTMTRRSPTRVSSRPPLPSTASASAMCWLPPSCRRCCSSVPGSSLSPTRSSSWSRRTSPDAKARTIPCPPRRKRPRCRRSPALPMTSCGMRRTPACTSKPTSLTAYRSHDTLPVWGACFFLLSVSASGKIRIL